MPGWISAGWWSRAPRLFSEPGTGERYKEGIQMKIPVSLHPYEQLLPNLAGSRWSRKSEKRQSNGNPTLPIVGKIVCFLLHGELANA